MSTELKFYEGLHGSGVVISLCCGKDRLIFDFGSPFTPLTQIEDGVLLPRKQAAVLDALTLGKLPEVEGLFSREALQEWPLLCAEKSPWNTAVLISHLHLDHMSGIRFVDPSIPVYLSEEAWRLEKALRAIGESETSREFQHFQLHQPFYVGKIRITAYFSDHPCAGSCGFLIETEDKTVFYSGDIRFHGLRREQAWKEIEALSKKKIDLLIVDAMTTAFLNDPQEILPSQEITEQQISEDQINKLISEKLAGSEHLAVFNLYHRDLQLIQSLIEIAKKQQRKLIFEPETAWIVQKMLHEPVAIWLQDYPRYQQHLPAWLQKLKKSAEIVPLSAICSHPQNAMVQCSYRSSFSLLDFQKIPTDYLHLYGEPMVEGTLSYQRLRSFLNRLNIQYIGASTLYCFNHAYPNHLAEMIRRLQPALVVPVHSSAPEKLQTDKAKLILPKQAKRYRLEENDLVELD